MAQASFDSALLLEEEKRWAICCHLSPLTVFLLPLFGHVLVPLIIWLFQRTHSDFIDTQGKEVLNFQISITIYGFVCSVGLILLGLQSSTWALLGGFILLVPLQLFWVICMIAAVIKVSEGQPYRYPLCIRFL